MLSYRYDARSKSLIRYVLVIMCLTGTYSSFAYAEHLFPLHLSGKPFSPTMCKGHGSHASIHIKVAKHRNLVLRRVSGQHIPQNSDEARQKDYVQYITLADLTNGQVTSGAIAFDKNHSIIFNDVYPMGISRPAFLNQQPQGTQALLNEALNTFLYIHPILNAAVDTCRPYPAKVAYETDDEILRIETGKHTYKELVRQHNNKELSPRFVMPYETGYANGYVDPRAGENSNISYQAMNPLNFYVPTSHP